jgi:hypothetical protein
MKNTTKSSKLPDAKSRTDADHKGKAEPVVEKKKHDAGHSAEKPKK